MMWAWAHLNNKMVRVVRSRDYMVTNHISNETIIKSDAPSNVNMCKLCSSSHHKEFWLFNINGKITTTPYCFYIIILKCALNNIIKMTRAKRSSWSTQTRQFYIIQWMCNIHMSTMCLSVLLLEKLLKDSKWLHAIYKLFERSFGLVACHCSCVNQWHCMHFNVCIVWAWLCLP